ncbi:MAG: hypothetical protein ABL996_01760 [Micropepsaceae bacterium]
MIHLTDKGRKAFEAMAKKQVPWANAVAKDVDADSIEAAIAVLAALCKKFDARVGE